MFYNADGGFQSLGFATDGRVLTLDNHARLAGWDVAAGRPERLHAIDHESGWAVLKGFRSAVGRVGILTPGGGRLRGGLHRFDLTTRTPLPPFSPEQGRVADVSEDGTLAVVNEPGVLSWRLWDVDTGQKLPDLFHLSGEGQSLPQFRYNPVLSPDNRVFAMSVVADGRLLVWERGSPKSRLLAASRRGQHYPFLAFPPDARFLAGAQTVRNGRVAVWDLSDGRLRWSLPQEVFVWALAVHPSGNVLAVATVGGPAGRAVRFLDAATGAEITRYNWNAGRIRCLSFRSDGLTCAAGSSDRRLVVWDVDI